jgi:RNA polymerase sigma-70 factor (ECF subfamily)
MTSDEGLMAQFRGGSRQAFDELFERYRETVFAFFRRRMESRARAEELTQETFLAVLRATERYEPRSAVRSYLFGIAFRLLSAERRKASHQAARPEEPARADATESALWVRQALARLDRGERDLLMLREYEQLSYDEIAALLKIPVNTVRSRLFRARMALKEYLEPAGKETSNA